MSFYLQGNAATDLREMVILIPISPAFVLNLTVEKKFENWSHRKNKSGLLF